MQYPQGNGFIKLNGPSCDVHWYPTRSARLIAEHSDMTRTHVYICIWKKFLSKLRWQRGKVVRRTSHHQRPSLSSWLGSTALVQGSHPMETYPCSCSLFVGTPCTQTNVSSRVRILIACMCPCLLDRLYAAPTCKSNILHTGATNQIRCKDVGLPTCSNKWGGYHCSQEIPDFCRRNVAEGVVLDEGTRAPL